MLRKYLLLFFFTLLSVSALADRPEDKAFLKKVEPFLSAKDMRSVVKITQEEADRGVALAMWNLSKFYQDGTGGLPRSTQNAQSWLLKAAEKDPSYHGALGDAFIEGRLFAKDVKRALQSYSIAADANNIHAQMKLAKLYLEGEVVPQNTEKSISLYSKAVDVNDEWMSVLAATELANIYKDGIGISKNVQKQVYWLKKAAELGDFEAKMEMAPRLYYGKDVQQDLPLAFSWAKDSDENKPSQMLLGMMHMTGKGASQDKVEAYKYFRLASFERPIFDEGEIQLTNDAKRNLGLLQKDPEMSRVKIKQALARALTWAHDRKYPNRELINQLEDEVEKYR